MAKTGGITGGEEFNKIAWEQACLVNPSNPMAVAEKIGELAKRLKTLTLIVRQTNYNKWELQMAWQLLADIERR